MLYKRPGNRYWQIKFSLLGKTVRRSSQTSDKNLAERIEHAAREEVIKSQLSGNKPPFSWEDACLMWQQAKHGKRSLGSDLVIMRQMKSAFGGLDVKKLTARHIADYGSAMIARGLQPGTANRHLALFKSLMKHLERMDYIQKAPNVYLYPDQIKEPVLATSEQIDVLLASLPSWARDISEFAVLTGLRRGNVFKLGWNMVDLVRSVVVIPAALAKGKKTIQVPLSPQAQEVLERRVGINATRVFTGFNGEHLRDHSLRKHWEQATKQAGLGGFRFHDLRHTWASVHAMAGTPNMVLMQLGGWSNLDLLQRYAHLRLDHIAKFVDNGNYAKRVHVDAQVNDTTGDTT